jgi:hypothetical protein
MPPQAVVVFRGPVDLLRPFTVRLRWDGLGEAPEAVALRYERTLQLFAKHLTCGAFLVPGRAGNGPLLPPPVEARLDAQSPLFDIDFPCLPYQPAALRLLLRALLYPHLLADSRVEVTLTGSPSPVASRPGLLLRGVRDLEVPLLELPLPFMVAARWCGKRLVVELTVRGPVGNEGADGLDQLMADWVVLANLGAYATADQMANFDPDEPAEMLVDVPTVGDDFIEWSVTRLGVGEECLTALLNMLSRAHALRIPIVGVRVE